MRSAKVPLSPSSALQTMYFCGAWRLRHRAPLDAGRETRTAAPAQTGLDHLLDQRRGVELQRLGQPGVTAMRAIVVNRQRIDDAASRKGQPRLALQKGNLFGQAKAQRMTMAAARDILEYGDDIAHLKRSIGDPAARGLDLNHRLKPIEPARTGPHHRERRIAARGFDLQRSSDLFRSDRKRAGIARNEN